MSEPREHEGIVGTPQYMAPEMVEDCSQVGPEADMWSLGADDRVTFLRSRALWSFGGGSQWAEHDEFQGAQFIRC